MKELSVDCFWLFWQQDGWGVWIYDQAYEYVQVHIWNKFQGKLLN